MTIRRIVYGTGLIVGISLGVSGCSAIFDLSVPQGDAGTVKKSYAKCMANPSASYSTKAEGGETSLLPSTTFAAYIEKQANLPREGKALTASALMQSRLASDALPVHRVLTHPVM